MTACYEVGPIKGDNCDCEDSSCDTDVDTDTDADSDTDTGTEDCWEEILDADLKLLEYGFDTCWGEFDFVGEIWADGITTLVSIGIVRPEEVCE